MTRNRLLIWVVMILLATNIATVVSVMRNSGERAEREVRGDAMADARVMFFRDHLELTEGQMADFMQLNRLFSQDARRMTTRLDILRRDMIEELAKAEPDMNRVEQITAEIGSLHNDLKQATAKYYLGLKKSCNPEQQERLKEMFMVMSDPQGDLNAIRRGPMGRPGQGPGPGQEFGGRGRNMRGMGGVEILRGFKPR
jgi:Spy/CpxP family protein refolding chaperone